MIRKEKPRKKKLVQMKNEDLQKPRKKVVKMKYRHQKKWLNADQEDWNI